MTIIKKGYKQTEIGVIPEDWEVSPLNDLAVKIGSGITPTGGESVYKEDGRPLVRSQNVGWGKLLLDDIAFIDDETHQTFPNTEIKLNDVFLNISGASIGRSSYANEKLVGGNVNQHVCIIRTNNQELNPIFLNLFLLSKKGQKQIDSFQSGGNRQGLNIGQIKTFLIPLPPTKEEQSAIATVLTDTDNLIQSLEKVIAKKRNIKQGAMQELLKPKDGWEKKPLREISYMKGRIGWQGLNQTEFTMNASEPFLITGMNFKDGEIRWDEVYHVPFERYEIAKEIQLKQNDVLMTKDGTIGKILFVDKIPQPHKATLNSHLLVFRPIQKSYIPKYLYYLLLSKTFKEHIEISKSGTTFFGISQESVGEFNVILPPIEEQTHIATILSDMDLEITSLETKLDKYKNIKQGMMQNLLTGKIRLI